MQWEKHLKTGRSDAGFFDGTWKVKTLGLTSPRIGKCGQTWSTNFFITLRTIKEMECASLMPIDLFFEAPRPMDSCNFMDYHPPHTREVRWYNIRLYSTYVRWKRIMHYSTHEELMFVNLCLLWSYSRWPRPHLARSYVNALCIRVGDK